VSFDIPLPATPRSASPRGLTSYANNNRGSAVLLLFGLLVLIRIVRHGGQMPDRREALGYFLGAMFFVLSAAIVPDFAAAFLLVLLLAAAFDAAPQIAAAINNLGALIAGQPTNPAGRIGGS